MNREIIQNILLAVFAVVIILMGWMLYVQNRTIIDFNDRLNGFSQSMMESSLKLDDAMMKMEEIQEDMEEDRMMRKDTMGTFGVTVGDLSFDLPYDWNVEFSGNTARIQVPDPNYNVTIPLSARRLDGQVEAAPFTAEFRMEETPSGAVIYNDACAPALLCRAVVYKGAAYVVTFEVPESDEPVPDNLDGVWFPGTTVTEAQMEAVIRTVH